MCIRDRFFVGDGKYANNSGKAEKTAPVNREDLDVRHIIDALRHKVSFMPMPNKAKNKNKCLFDEIVVNNSFIDLNGSTKMSIAKSFDGIVLIDKTSMPIKLDFSN